MSRRATSRPRSRSWSRRRWRGEKNQVLLGVTGSGKTFTMAKVIETLQRPALVLAPNKILAAQLYGEFKSFFPDNAVEYFVSYYDYYQPEAYVPRSDTYIEKESSVNEAIDRMRHSATRSLLERDDVIIVASVSLPLRHRLGRDLFGDDLRPEEGRRASTSARSSASSSRCSTSATTRPSRAAISGCAATIWKSSRRTMRTCAWRISFFGDEIEEIVEFDPLTGKKVASLDSVRVYANSHYVTPGPTLKQAMEAIRHELAERLKELVAEGRLLEAQRLEQRTNFDLEMIAATGSCAGIENYSRFLTGRLPGEPPPTLFEYLPDNALAVRRRKPPDGAADRRDGARATTAARSRSPNMASACRAASTTGRCASTNGTRCARRRRSSRRRPGPWEMDATGGVFSEQVIRPTGLIDPPVEIKPVEDQVDDLVHEAKETARKGYRTLVTTLTKRMAEDLTEYLHEAGLARPLHALATSRRWSASS